MKTTAVMVQSKKTTKLSPVKVARIEKPLVHQKSFGVLKGKFVETSDTWADDNLRTK